MKAYGLCHRFCPQISSFIVQAEQAYPGPTGLQWCTASYLYEFNQRYGHVVQKYPLRWFMHDKFFLALDFTSDELNKTDPEISLSGAELRRSGNFLNF